MRIVISVSTIVLNHQTRSTHEIRFPIYPCVGGVSSIEPGADTVFCKTYCVSRKVRFESLNFFALRNMARTFALVRNGTYLVKVEAVTNH
jgi:hypothetical protein